MPPPVEAPRERSTWFLARRLFLVGMAASYGTAYASLGAQVQGLFGSRGIAPLCERMELLRAELTGWERLQVPTLFWFGASDALLTVWCLAGVALALVAALGLAPRACFALLWLGYLSLVSVGWPFLNFQWDALLLEAGLVTIFVAPAGLRRFLDGFRPDERPPSPAMLWLVRWLLFRLVLLSGLVKLGSGDESWWDLSALDYHYWTQPLPHRLSHHVHHLPEWFRQMSVLVMFAIELGAPLLMLGSAVLLLAARRGARALARWGRRLDQLAAGSIVLLMALISATGNYGFFDLLTAVLCIPLLDDRVWRRLLFLPGPVRVLVRPASAWRRIGIGSVAALVLLLTTTVTLRSLQGIRPRPGAAPQPLAWLAELPRLVPRPLEWLSERASVLGSFNSYGLFRVMTKERPEIVIEGSADGRTWEPYRFRYKPLELERAPVFAGPHMPRLDWQMWFAALEHGQPRRSRWYEDFLRRLLSGSRPVLELLGEDPFPGAPPRFLRSTVWLYEFSSQSERRAGTWWRRRDPRPFLPVVTLEAGELRAAR